MQISILDRANIRPSVVLLQTPSTHLNMFIEDKLKRQCGARSESILAIRSKADIKTVKAFNTLYPPVGDRWFVQIDLDEFNDKDIIKLIGSSSTCLYFITCSKYIQFKNMKDALKKQGVSDVYDFYINFLGRSDFLYLYDAFVPEDKRLNKQLFDFVKQGYSGDIDTVFKLWLELANGTKFTTRKAITDFCGLGGLTVESIIFSLLKDISGSDKGLKKVMNNRIRACTELATSLGYSSLYNFMCKSLYNMIQLKCLMISGKVYKTVMNLPECYDEKSLARYQRYIWRLKQIPLSRLLLLRQMLGYKRWNSELDIFQFIYSYYNNIAKQFLKGGNI